MIESVQRRCSKFGPLSALSYEDRLASLNLSKLDIRRVRGELIQVFKYICGFDNISLIQSPLSHNTNTRGFLKLNTELCNHSSRSNFLFNRVTKVWNALPIAFKQAKTVNEFKNLLDGIVLADFL